MPSYTYETGDFPGDIDPTTLHDELTIINGYDKLIINGDQIIINTTELVDQDLLDNIIANHSKPEDVIDVRVFKRKNSNTVIRTDDIGNEYIFDGSNPNIIKISKDGQYKYTSITQAIADHDGIENMAYIIYPGVYYEPNPLVLPDNCAIKGASSAANTKIIAINPNEKIIVPGKQCMIRDLMLIGAYGPNGAGISYDGSGELGLLSVCNKIMIINCCVGFESYNGPNLLVCTECIVAPGITPVQIAYGSYDGGRMVCNVTGLSGSPENMIQTGYLCSGAESTMSGSQWDVSYCNQGVYLDDNAYIATRGAFIRACNTGIYIGPNGTKSKLFAASALITHTIGNDMEVLPTDASIFIASGIINEQKILNVNNIPLNLSIQSTTEHTNTQLITGDLHIGAINRKASMYMGEGGKYSHSLVLLNNSNLEVGTFNDLTDNNKSENPLPVNLFNTTNVGECFYYGSNYPILGLYIEMTTAGTGPVNACVMEYWNGNDWVHIPTMMNLAEEPYYNILTPYWQLNSNVDLRFGIKYQNNDMSLKTLNGYNKYWVRTRLTQSITSLPKVKIIKLHPTSLSINDGYIQQYGDSREIQKLSWDLNSMVKVSQNLNDNNLYLCNEIDIGHVNNGFPPSINSRIGFNDHLPYNIDTSFPIKVIMSCTGNVNSTGVVRWLFKWKWTNENNDIYLENDTKPEECGGKSQIFDVTIPINTKNKQHTHEFKLNIEGYQARPQTGNSDILWLSIERSGESIEDTYLGEISIIHFSAFYIKWCSGGHISQF